MEEHGDQRGLVDVDLLRKIGQGRDAVKELLKNDDALRNEIEAKVREAMKAPKQ